MKTLWFTSKDSEEKKETITNYLSTSSVLIERLVEILDKEITSNSTPRIEDYDNASWPYKRADRDGYIRGLLFVKKLFKD